MTAPLGRLVSVPLREVWPHEANDFTPWLAKKENLSLLAETLQLSDLQLQDTEVAVGSFYIDILARDIEGRVVVIENQFGPTDHTHLGQIMTYVAGQEGRATVIWIAEKFRDEHRAAIDWLNTATNEDFDFFAVEVEALRIAELAAGTLVQRRRQAEQLDTRCRSCGARRRVNAAERAAAVLHRLLVSICRLSRGEERSIQNATLGVSRRMVQLWVDRAPEVHAFCACIACRDRRESRAVCRTPNSVCGLR